VKHATASGLGQAGIAIPLATPSLDAAIDAPLKRKVAVGFIVALLLTVFMGFSSWRSTRLAENDADWEIHTYAVMDALRVTLQHVVEVETSARTFALIGQQPLLADYEAARDTVAQDKDALRSLTLDNPNQQRRLEVLEPQVRDALAFAAGMVAKRQQAKAVAGAGEILETETLMSAVRATTQAMQAEEMRLLSQRSQRTRTGRQITSLIMVIGVLVGASLLTAAKFAVSREIGVSARGRAQLQAMNTSLEQRVDERTAALQSEIGEHRQAKVQLAGQAEELSRQAEELVRSGQALEAQTLILRSVLDSMAEGLVAADEQGKFVIWNPAAQKILGLGASDLPSQKWTEHYGLYLADTVTPFPTDQLPLVRAIRGETSTAEMFVRNPAVAGGVWIEASGGPLKDKDGTVRGGVVAFRDITQRRAAEGEIQKLNDELEARVLQRTSQLEASNKELEAFTYSVSHDLRAPLRHISGYSKILDEEFGTTLSSGGQHYLQRIREGTHRMGQLVDELLSLAQMGRRPLSLQMTGLDSVVKEVVALLEPEIKDREVEWRISGLPFVECDPILIKQVFQNLIENALKYSRPRPKALIEVGCTEKDGTQVFFVRDNGVGFNMKYADKLFGVFQRLHRAEDFEGTGIGLATAQRVVHKHGGRIWAEAELEKGATFYWTLGGSRQSETKTPAAAGEDHE
jgi:PAS domain S-box-containing protein